MFLEILLMPYPKYAENCIIKAKIDGAARNIGCYDKLVVWSDVLWKAFHTPYLTNDTTGNKYSTVMLIFLYLCIYVHSGTHSHHKQYL